MGRGRGLVALALLANAGCGRSDLDVPSSGGADPAEVSGLHASMDGLRWRPDADALARIGQVGLGGLSATEVNAMSDGQQQTLASVARCALAPDVALDYGGGLVLKGALGLAPEIEHGACELACQEILSACLLAHINWRSTSVPIWLTSAAPAMGHVTSSSYPIEEATFFGNLWASGSPAVYCKARTASEGRIPGRLGVLPGDGESYEDLRSELYYRDADQRQPGTCAACARTPSGAIESCALEGATFAHPVTVWRARTYEAEAANLSGGAQIGAHADRVLDVRVSSMKPGAGVIFEGVFAAHAGSNALAIYYTNGDPVGSPERRLAIAVNGAPVHFESFRARGTGWNDPQLRFVTVDGVRQGTNTIAMSVPADTSGPDLDWIEVVPPQP
jgi:hypothetical protein